MPDKDKQTVTLRIEQDGNAIELDFDTWKDFVKMMRRMGPLWNQAQSLESLMRQLESVWK